MTEYEVSNIAQKVSRLYCLPVPLSAFQLLENIKFISTGVGSIDELLSNGIPTHSITEIYGQAGTGKTQFLLMLAVTSQLPERFGGLNANVIYISTESSFPFKRFCQIATEQVATRQLPVSIQDLMNNIHVITIKDAEHQEHLIKYQLAATIEKYNVKLVLIDSISANYRGENVTNSRSKEIYSMANSLKKIAYKGVAVVCSNQVSDTIDAPMFPGNQVHPILGSTWTSAVDHRLFISRSSSLHGVSVRKLQVIFSSFMQNRSTLFTINSHGLCEYS